MSTATTNHPQIIASTDTPDSCNGAIPDPPPPYPTRERRTRTLRAHRRPSHQADSLHTHTPSANADSEPLLVILADDEENVVLPSDNTHLLPHQHAGSRHYGATGRPRAYSYTSSVSAAPSITHTVLSFFQGHNEAEAEGYDASFRGVESADDNESLANIPSRSPFFSPAAWRQYFRALSIKAYYKSLFHLLVINFPYGLIAWVYLFVFTVTGTTLLVALPLGAFLCFFDLLGARTFSRWELALQYHFHRSSTLHHVPYPPRPIFVRYREATLAELEENSVLLIPGGLVPEKSFYKNAYSMFTDSTSYQALFYFLVIKPVITLLISIGVVAIALPLCLLILPAPAVLRALRKIGIWQANVAIEGLYVPVR